MGCRCPPVSYLDSVLSLIPHDNPFMGGKRFVSRTIIMDVLSRKVGPYLEIHNDCKYLLGEQTL
jgi:hypothetical protein